MRRSAVLPGAPEAMQASLTVTCRPREEQTNRSSRIAQSASHFR